MKMYLGRVNGYALLMLFVGIVGHYLFEEKILVVAIPILIMWLMSYDEASYKFKNEKKKHESEVMRNVIKR